MPFIYFHPDISYQEIKLIEEKYNLNDSEYLINKASDFIIEVLSKGKSKDKKFLFICGKGSNGLDGIYSCYKLKKLGYQVNIISLDERNISYLEKFEIKNNLIKDFKSDDFDCIVDCIFGYGFNRDLNSSYIKLINKINSSRSFIYSVDVPTGLHPDTGKLCPISVRCDTLISLISYKRGIFTNQGRDTWRSLFFSNLIGKKITCRNYLISANKSYSQSDLTKDYSQENHYSQHKKTNGINCIISGERPYHGAMILSAEASIKAGCQYLNIYTDEEYALTLPMIIPEIIAKPFSVDDFKENIKNYKNILIGPGMNKACEQYLEIILSNLNYIDSLVVDAGALKYLNKNHLYSHKLIITPHPGEAASLLGVKVSEVQNNRYKSAEMLHEIFDCIVVLKGSGTIIYDGKNFYTCMDGNYRMAVAGMGDVLSGILLQELSMGSEKLDSCIKAVTFHSYAADYLLNHTKKMNFTPSMIPDIYSNLVN